MGIYLERIPIDNEAARIYGQIPEFSKFPPKNVLFVDEGDMATGPENKTFISLGFHSCSAILFKDRYDKKFGLFHVYPGQEPEDVIEKLTLFSDGVVCLIQGSNSTEKRRIFQELPDTLGIQRINTIPVETIVDHEKYYVFHVAYQPRENRVLVARTSHKDVVAFPAFPS